MALLGSLACAPAVPEVARVLQPEGLDPEVARLVEEHAAAARADPTRGALHGELGLVYEANALWPEARAAFATAEALAPEEPSWSLHLAVATLQGGDFEGALAELRELVARAPELAPARQRLGVALLETCSPSAAREHFEAVGRLAPRSAEGPVGLARVALAEGDHGRAVGHLERALALEPRHPQTRFLLAQTLRRLGREEQAERLAVRAGAPPQRFLSDAAGRRMAGYAAGALRLLARAREELEAGRPAEAVALLEELLEREPGRADVENNLAIAYAGAGRLADALALLDEACAREDASAGSWTMLAVARLDAGELDSALEAAERALALEPASSRAHFARGSALLRLRRLEEARAALAEAHRRNRKDPAVRLALGEACLRLGLLEEAEGQLAEAARRLPRNAQAWLLLARVRLAAGRPEPARSCVERARALAPDAPELAGLERLLAQGDER